MCHSFIDEMHVCCEFKKNIVIIYSYSLNDPLDNGIELINNELVQSVEILPNTNNIMDVRIRKSTHKGKKYDAILDDGTIVPFGQLGYEHYKDTTPLKLYSNLDHKDDKRKLLFQERFRKLYEKNKNNPKSSIFWSWNFLW